MGRSHAHKLVRNPRAQVTGFAEIADVRTKHTKDLIEKHYSQNSPGHKWKGLKITNDYLELIEDKSVDAVLIATPIIGMARPPSERHGPRSMFTVKSQYPSRSRKVVPWLMRSRKMEWFSRPVVSNALNMEGNSVELWKWYVAVPLVNSKDSSLCGWPTQTL